MMFHVVDDEPFVREIIIDVLIDSGYEATGFSRPDDYIEFVERPDYKPPAAVFTDVNMPAMSGYEMINVLSALRPDLKFVVMTGEPETRSEYQKLACMFLSKPFHPDELIKVAKCLVACCVSSPSVSHGCSSADNRKHFNLKSMACPKACKCA